MAELTVREGTGMGGGGPVMPLGQHLGRTAMLAWPIMVARAMTLFMFTVDTIMTGWAGADELARLGLGIAPQLAMMVVAIGALQGTVVLTARADGAGETARIGTIWRAAVLHAVLLGILMASLAVFAEPFFLAMGQDPAIAADAARISHQFAWGVPGLLLFIATNMVLEATGRPRIGMAIMLGANVANILLNGVLVLGWGGLVEPMGGAGAVAGSSALRWAAALVVLAVFLRLAARAGDPAGIFAGFSEWRRMAARFGGETGRGLRRIGIPSGLANGLESSAFAAVVMIAGTIGVEALAAHQVVMTLLSLSYMLALGAGGAATIRVGNAVGRRRPGDVTRAGWVALGFGVCVLVPGGLVLVSASEAVARLFVSEPAVLAILVPAVALAGVIVVVDGAMGIVIGALRGLADVWVPTMIQAISFWILLVPVAYIGGAALGLGPVGLVGAILVAVSVCFAALSLRFRVVSRRAARALGPGLAPEARLR